MTISDRFTHRRFPRPRGDGPQVIPLVVIPPPVSPPTRGWTAQRRPRPTEKRGFPAHAGMDPRQGVGVAACDRFPRPRGDGPRDAASSARLHGVSPPTRGWTPGGCLNIWLELGFPAHAGMDRSRRSGASAIVGFPRPRGDGPVKDVSWTGCTGVSPPTRGWTGTGPRAVSHRRGFPAHAGMDPRSSRRTATTVRFPRPRGDGPGAVDAVLRRRAVSPPTRGWTCKSGWSWRRMGGFPAHAGMDPRKPFYPTKQHRFPRPRGDGPGI